MTISTYAHELAGRIKIMAEDSALNNAGIIQSELEALFQKLVEQRNPVLRSQAENELLAVQAALRGYPNIPQDTWIGDNTTDDKVLWLVRRLLMTEETLANLRKEMASNADMLDSCLLDRKTPPPPRRAHGNA